ncbi:asm-3 [Pristionchus pacificus]|uniref:Sphingomyelin phosphodiesterase n=1 Tax=Pristionchus pacificus TaxID=54126 RepID=A0A2A6C5H1_PRIPA|nr:asm-3 [Pristionchus pacificus]|eukprot:PDM73357.1 asm-3 [Pristionchus pacificus]
MLRELTAAVLLLLGCSLAAPATKVSNLETSCSTCEFAVRVIHNMWGSDTMDECAEEFIDSICETLQIEDHFVCSGIASAFAEEAVWVIGEILIEPEELCGLLIDGCGNFVNPLTQQWNLSIAPNKPSKAAAKPIDKTKPTLKVLHLSDLHIDRKYTVGLEAQCGEPQCCRPIEDPEEIFMQKPNTNNAGDKIVQPAGKWGTVADCDTPYWLFTNMLDHIAATHKDIDYVVVSGDLESHADWDYTRERHQEMVKNSSDTIRDRLNNLPTFFAVGNHEGVPIDSFAPHFTPEKFHMDWLYGTMADAWSGWVPEDQMDTVWYMGCYMRKMWPGLRVISLNNGYGDHVNFFLYVNQTDPDGSLSWFQNQLVEAEKAGDKVHVVAHIPGGSGEALEGWAINYYKVINRFEDTITAQFFGHTHSEEFNMFYENPDDASSRPTGVTWSAPSLTTYSEYFPAYRVYTIEGQYAGSQYRVIDWAEYYVNITEANANPTKDPEWKTLYASVLAEYEMDDASPAEWDKFITKMITDDKLFGRYRKNFYRQTDKGECDWSCRRGFLCSARKNHHFTPICDDLPLDPPSGGRRVSTLSSSSITRKSKRRKITPNLEAVPTKEEILARARKVVSKHQMKKNRADGKCIL